jgi:hypothetical protein
MEASLSLYLTVFHIIAYTTADHAEHTDQALLQAIGTIYLTLSINLYRGGRC